MMGLGGGGAEGVVGADGIQESGVSAMTSVAPGLLGCELVSLLLEQFGKPLATSIDMFETLAQTGLATRCLTKLDNPFNRDVNSPWLTIPRSRWWHCASFWRKGNFTKRIVRKRV